MKKLSFIMMAAALAFGFASCKDDNGGKTDLDKVVEDGFYVAGAATGSEALTVEYRMSTGTNEVTKEPRAGMYEKYVALEADKDFYLLLKEGTVETRYSAALEEFNTEGENEQPNVILHRGELKTGAEAPAMRVAKSGLYHILLDLNTAKDLEYPQIIVAPVDWYISYGDVLMTPSEFNRTEMTWTCNIDSIGAGNFKFRYGKGWKIQLDLAGTVKAETNLGATLEDGKYIMKSGGADIDILNGTNVVITLKWHLAAGEVGESFSMTLDGDWVKVPFDQNTQYSFIGSITDAGWGIDTDLTFVSGENDHYVYEAKGLDFAAGEFKIRVNHDWAKSFGWGQLKIEGAAVSDNAGNIALAAPFQGSAKFEFDWNGAKETNVVLTFTPAE